MDTEFIKKALDSYTVVDPSTNCWLYSRVNSDGYGQTMVGPLQFYVHRLSAAIYLGLDLNDSETCALHKIICPNKNCWNPEHLYIGTKFDNNQDIKQTGTGRGKYSDVTHCINGHEFTEENTYWCKSSNGNKRRQCRACKSARSQQYEKNRFMTGGVRVKI